MPLFRDLQSIAGEDYQTGNYTLTVTYYGPSVANDLCEEAIAIDHLNTTISGSTVGATGQDITERAGDDAYDVWYSFTPEINAVYQVNRIAVVLQGGLSISRQSLM